MIKLDTLPNFCNGKLYKRWESVRSVYGGGIIASKTAKDGSTVQLVLSENGKRRVLHFPEGKVMDTISSDGIKRTYKYEKIDENKVKGQMFASADKNGRLPLVIAAKWITENIMPQKLFLKINKNHPQAKTYIPDLSPEGTPYYSGKVNKVDVEEVLAKDFDNTNEPLPKVMLLKTVKGNTEPLIATDNYDNSQMANHFQINSEFLGQNLRTVV